MAKSTGLVQTLPWLGMTVARRGMRRGVPASHVARSRSFVTHSSRQPTTERDRLKNLVKSTGVGWGLVAVSPVSRLARGGMRLYGWN